MAALDILGLAMLCVFIGFAIAAMFALSRFMRDEERRQRRLFRRPPRPSRPRLTPGTWYFEAGVDAHSPMTCFTVVTVTQRQCELVNNNTLRTGWRALLAELEPRRAWPIVEDSPFCEPAQWFQIHPMNSEAILDAARNGMDIAWLRELDRRLIEALA